MSDASAIPDFAEFARLAEPGRMVPVAIEIPFDLDTPVTAFSKLRRGAFSFLLESVEGGERWARFSFLGSEPREAWRLDGSEIRLWTVAGGWGEPESTSDPFGAFEDWITGYEPVEVPGLPRFWGGAVGYFGYDTVRWIERLPGAPPDDLGVPDACFMSTEHMLIIDDLYSRAFAVAAVTVAPDDDPYDLYTGALERLAEWVRGLEAPHGLRRLGSRPGSGPEVVGNRSRDDYEAAVDRIRDYIVAGDAYQVVVSQRAGARFRGDPLELYRALRRSNPSPYLFFNRTGRHAPHRLLPRDARPGRGRDRDRAGRSPGLGRAGPRQARTNSTPATCSPTKRSGPSTSCSSTSAATMSAGWPVPAPSRCPASWRSSATAMSCTS